MSQRLFFSQQKLEAWIDKGEVTFQDGILTLLAQKVSYRVDAAVLVKSLIDGKDQKGLLGKNFTVAELSAMGAEHFDGTVILGDVGYVCEDGFVGHEEGGKPEVVPTPAVLPPRSSPHEGIPDAKMLAASARSMKPAPKPTLQGPPPAAKTVVAHSPPPPAKVAAPVAPKPAPAKPAAPNPAAPKPAASDAELLTDFLLKNN